MTPRGVAVTTMRFPAQLPEKTPLPMTIDDERDAGRSAREMCDMTRTASFDARARRKMRGARNSSPLFRLAS